MASSSECRRSSRHPLGSRAEHVLRSDFLHRVQGAPRGVITISALLGMCFVNIRLGVDSLPATESEKEKQNIEGEVAEAFPLSPVERRRRAEPRRRPCSPGSVRRGLRRPPHSNNTDSSSTTEGMMGSSRGCLGRIYVDSPTLTPPLAWRGSVLV